MELAREAEEPPGSPALPAEEPQGGHPTGAPAADGPVPSAAGRGRCRRGAGPKGPPGRAVRGRGRRAPGRRGGEEGGRAVRRPRVTVDSSKAKTSLEALKISLRQLHWREYPFGRRLPCDIYWHGVSFHDNNIFSGQVNKFPGMTEMVRKVTLSRAVRTMQDLFPLEYNFYPRSWILPEELPLFVDEVRMMKDSDPSWKPTFIVKPDGGCQGDGIYLIKDPSDIRQTGSIQSRPAVVQEYICKPLLVDKLKFDIRLYVLLKSLEPLEIYIAKDGLSRFCTEPYQEPTLKNLHQVFMHLTNYSLNIHSGNFIHSDSVNTGSKRTFSSILCRLSSRGADVKKLWSDIISLVIKTIIALTPELKVYYQSDIPAGKPGPTCFQILGFDILLMKNLKPMLLEVNANPSMRIEHEQELSPGVFENVPSPVDEEVKVAVIRDTLRLMDPQNKKRKDIQSGALPCLSNCLCYLFPGHQGSDLCQDGPSQRLRNKCQTSEHVSEANEDLLDIGPADGPEHETTRTLEPELPSLCLKQVFPKYAKQFNYLRIVDRVAALFIRFLGVKGTTKLGPTGFRTFIRNCKLSNSNFSMACVDILYIDITRRRNGMGMDHRESGMCLQAFVEAFFCLAQKKYKSLPLHQQVTLLIDFCEYQLAVLDEKRRAVCHADGPHLTPATHPSLLGRSASASKLSDYRNHR
ncbi:tubulin polyglutamylase TTLL11 isoform X1 [Neopsephotus bourkii]|uniref:tubulin polyglutamylase TTLL11 isoform X1 n=2 Tax=Neopsephotus bourkii TaxID=309878 RepID=UPI002AA5B509|nr:tubulin polyglutamylase TTLL11 isoform X1 [Neopsephotus bourkii]XP_061208505.1 tubulin polyglutamylase TTLL11 isoform X1 [Neopsephotus bourkii]XP_061208506.1 tubulin polyglutamylase TTLL11 isoform X1 [Neopsephotus bourkii]